MILLLFFSSIITLAISTFPIVEIEDGKLEGTVGKDLNGNTFYSFLSVPYARPPVGENRFKDPEPSSKWDGVRNAKKDLPLCFQRQWDGSFHGDEDCLYLNVHTSEVSTKNLKPVMVFIHGGGFTEGTGQQNLYGPEFLMIEDIVLVTINYRLGVLGFLNFDDPSLNIPGNAALKDQLMALKWVKKNIHHFGGDPREVTIFGESAGGASVHLHVLSPLSQGYFHRAIAMSGIALAAWCNGAQNNGPHAAKHLGYEGSDEVEMLQYLQKASLDGIKKISENQTILIPLYVPSLFGPSIEKRSKNAFLPDSPHNLVKKGSFQKVPFMIGYTDKDGMIVDVLHFIKFGKYDPLPISKLVPYFIDPTSQTEKENLKQEINQFYFPQGHQPLAMINLETDAYFTWAIYETLFGHLKHQEDIFLYVFSSDTKMNFMKRLHPVTAGYKGACHMDELGHLFTNVNTTKVEQNSIEDKSIRLTTKLFANFATYGIPTEKGFGVKWEPTNRNNFKSINILNDKINVEEAPRKDDAIFWCNLFKKYQPDYEMFCDWSNVRVEL